MTNRERALAGIALCALGYAKGIEMEKIIIIPSTGREIRKTDRGTWEVQPIGENNWMEFDDFIDAIICGNPRI